MTAGYSYKKIDHSPGGNAAEIISSVNGVFSLRKDDVRAVKEYAREVSDLIESLDTFQQDCCRAVCPQCTSICCVNRHAYHEHEDIVYLAALGRKMPSYDIAVEDTAPCQFLGERGCVIERRLRPHRCNSYFCAPLLDHMRGLPGREHRRFIAGLELITRKRERMLEAYYFCNSGLRPFDRQ
ncbi:MAG: hypothetical protein HZB33_12635 [Nitrospirae bacterium]|nr:hypothetical protein [Nitrospirota bacterium]